MTGVGRSFARLVHEATDWWGSYPPPLPVTVGDVLEFRADGSMNRLGSSWNWPGWSSAFPIDSSLIKAEEQYSASATRKLAASAGAGSTVAGGIGATASIELSFSRSAGFVLDYTGAQWNHYRNTGAVKEWVLALAKNGQWPEQQALVTEVIAASSATVIMAEEDGTTVAVNLSASVPDIAALNLADPSLKVTATTTKGSALISVCTGSTPLYHCIRVRKGWLGKWHAELQAVDNGGVDAAFADSPFDDDV